jgi:ABC-type glycerol-3-phosphate transport system substrate-binding protein
MMQRKLKEVASLFLCGLLLTVCISGCGNSVKTGGAGKVSISIGNWPNAEAKPKAYEVYTNKLKKFTDENPNIEIEPDEFQYDVRTFLPKAEGGTLPTVYATYFTEASKIIELGYAADITEALKKFGYYEKVNEYILEMISKNGQVYMIPNSWYSLGLVLNLDLFKEAGFMDVDEDTQGSETFDELISVCQKPLLKKQENLGLYFQPQIMLEDGILQSWHGTSERIL